MHTPTVPEWKRWFDVILIIMFSPLWLPIFGIVYLLVKRQLGAPVFFMQTRPGLGGKLFTIYKFRTMTDKRYSDTGELLPDDKRLTKFGKFLRATSLDELPELFNVLMGDMSLVGPRPLLPEYLDKYTPEQARRHEVLPGITGWAQIHGRNGLSWPEVFSRDVWYVDNANPILDIVILFCTIGTVFKRTGITEKGQATRSKFMGQS